MTLDADVDTLSIALQRLHDSLVGVRVSVVEDCPDDVALVDVVGDGLEDLLGWLCEAIAATAEVREALREREDLDEVRRALWRCTAAFDHIPRRFTGETTSYERLRELARLGKERGREWRAWSASVLAGLQRCHEPLYDASDGLLHCWQAVAERAGTAAVSVRNTNVGQHVAVRRRHGLAKEPL